MKISYPYLLVVILVIFSAKTEAHTLILKNGSRVKGKITNQTKTEIHLQTDSGIKIYPKSDIQEVDYADAPVVKKQPPKPAVAETAKPDLNAAKKERPLNQTDLLWRSAVLPGWGQYKVKQNKWAYLEGSATFLALGYSYSQHQKALQEKQNYKDSITQSFVYVQSTALPGASATDSIIKQFVLGIAPYNTYQAQVNRNNTSLKILGAVYAAQLLHSWIMGKKNVRSSTPVMAIGLVPDTVSENSLSYRLQPYISFQWLF